MHDFQLEALSQVEWIWRWRDLCPTHDFRLEPQAGAYLLNEWRYISSYQICISWPLIMHATFEASVLYHSISRPNLRESSRYGFHCSILSRTIVYIIAKPSLQYCLQVPCSLLPIPRYSILFVLLFATRKYTQTLCHIIRQTSHPQLYI